MRAIIEREIIGHESTVKEHISRAATQAAIALATILDWHVLMSYSLLAQTQQTRIRREKQ